LDLPELAKQTNAKPVLIEALAEPKNPGGYPIGGQTSLNLRNEHLSYAATWFTLSFFLTGMAMYIFKRPLTVHAKITKPPPYVGR